VVKGLFRYVRNECDGLDPLLDTPGLKAVLEKGKAESVFEVTHCFRSGQNILSDFTYQILIVLLMAAINGPHRETYIISITALTEDVQAEIAELIKKKQQEVERAVSAPFNVQGEQPGNDIELEFEARYVDLITQKKTLEQEKDRLKKLNADLATRLERLQDNHDHLQESLAAAEDKLQGVARDKSAADVIRSLETRLREQDELIANQEGQFEQDRIDKARMRKELDRLKSADDLASKLQDEIKELQFQNAELTKKSNTLDRYKQKLESQRDFQTDIKTLELDNEELQMRVKDFELLKHRNETLELTHKKFENTMSRHEMEIFELSSQKKALEEENSDLKRNIIRLEEVRASDEEHIAELQEQIADRPQTLSSPTGPSFGSLEAELEQSESGTRTSLEVSRLRAENQLLKGNATAAQDAAALRIQLEEEERIRKREEQKYNELYEKHVIASQQVQAILEASTSEGLVKGVNAAMLIGQLEILTPEYYSSEVFANLRRSYLNCTEKLSAAEKRVYELESDLESTKRDLLTATNDRKSFTSLSTRNFFEYSLTNYIVNMVAQEDRDALEDLKATQESLASSTEMELKRLQSRYKDLQIDFDQQKSQLIQALLSKDKLQQSINEYQAKDGSKVDESTERNQMRDNLEKSLSDLKTSQEVGHTTTGHLSKELAREQALLGYGPVIKVTLPPEEAPLPDSPTILSSDGRPLLHLEQMTSSESVGSSSKQNISAHKYRPKPASSWSWKIWHPRKIRDPESDVVSLKKVLVPPDFEGFSLSIPQKKLVEYTRNLADDVVETPKTG
jgi:protein HOOK3